MEPWPPAQPHPLPAACQQQPGPAGMVPSVQPEVIHPRHGRQPPPGLCRGLASSPGPRGEPGRRERQHGPALQRLPLQLPHREAAAGHGSVPPIPRNVPLPPSHSVPHITSWPCKAWGKVPAAEGQGELPWAVSVRRLRGVEQPPQPFGSPDLMCGDPSAGLCPQGFGMAHSTLGRAGARHMAQSVPPTSPTAP